MAVASPQPQMHMLPGILHGEKFCPGRGMESYRQRKISALEVLLVRAWIFSVELSYKFGENSVPALEVSPGL